MRSVPFKFSNFIVKLMSSFLSQKIIFNCGLDTFMLDYVINMDSYIGNNFLDIVNLISHGSNFRNKLIDNSFRINHRNILESIDESLLLLHMMKIIFKL